MLNKTNMGLKKIDTMITKTKVLDSFSFFWRSIVLDLLKKQQAEWHMVNWWLPVRIYLNRNYLGRSIAWAATDASREKRSEENSSIRACHCKDRWCWRRSTPCEASSCLNVEPNKKIRGKLVSVSEHFCKRKPLQRVIRRVVILFFKQCNTIVDHSKAKDLFGCICVHFNLRSTFVGVN